MPISGGPPARGLWQSTSMEKKVLMNSRRWLRVTLLFLTHSWHRLAAGSILYLQHELEARRLGLLPGEMSTLEAKAVTSSSRRQTTLQDGIISGLGGLW